ncbi:MAG: phosphatase PAP2 family protein [Oscillospiraceae bacterium]|nr:phosphatase PAP2 family protein [Oscillospiraceae bacterium]
MELTAAASWLNTAFAGYDRMILSLLHSVANGFFTFLFKLITLLGEKGILFFLAAIILMCFPKTRKLGVCIFGAVCCGALITNVILKDAVARPRPLTVLPYSQWWAEIKAPAEDGWSFPSGHVTAAAAGMVAIRLMRGKRWTVPAIVWILLMMIARNYLMAHYPTDVLAAAIIGVASAFISYYITYFIFQFIYINRKKKWCGLVLTWSAPDYYGIPSRLKLTGEADEKEFTFLRKPSSGEKQDPGAPEGEAPKQKKWQLPNITLPGKKSNSGYQGKHVK